MFFIRGFVGLSMIANFTAATAALATTQRVAKSNVNDPSARQIVRTVANETLKPISTKETVTMGDEEGPILTPVKVEIEDAPGTRLPAEDSTPSIAREPQSSVDEKVNTATEVSATSASSSVSAEQALSWLKNGNTRFVKNSVRKDGSKQSDRQRLEKSEKPYAIVLACSDSRVPPETVFDQALGEIHVIRTAGQTVDTAVIASIEHAVQKLEPKLLVVLGHTSCSAVHTALHAHGEDSAGSPDLDKLVATIRPRMPTHLQSRAVASQMSAGLEIESSANAQGAAADLTRKSEILRRLVESGGLVIRPALYHLDSGTVKFY